MLQLRSEEQLAVVCLCVLWGGGVCSFTPSLNCETMRAPSPVGLSLLLQPPIDGWLQAPPLMAAAWRALYARPCACMYVHVGAVRPDANQEPPPHLMAVVNSGNDLPEEMPGLSFRESPLFTNVVVQISSAGVLHHNHYFVFVFKH